MRPNGGIKIMGKASEPAKIDVVDFVSSKTDEEWAIHDAEMQEREAAAIHAKRMNILAEIRPTAFAETDPNRLAIAPQKIERVMNWTPSDGRGLLLHGETGAGKTRLVWLLLTRLVMRGIVPLYFPADQLARSLSGSYAQKHGHDALIEKLFRRRVVVLDDLGKEKPTARLEEDVYAIVRERTDNLRPLIITTNFVGDGLVARYSDPEMGKPLVRRLREFCETISCP